MSQLHAVVIDDEPDLTAFISTILETNGFEVRTANDASAGEELILQQPPDVILIDLMMPGRSGVHLFARLSKNEVTKDIPLVMVTGIKEQMGVDWGEVAGQFKVRQPDGYVEKPIDPDRLMSVVRGVLSGEKSEGEVLRA
jgi:DNA-binding response OmpR family regulator